MLGSRLLIFRNRRDSVTGVPLKLGGRAWGFLSSSFFVCLEAFIAAAPLNYPETGEERSVPTEHGDPGLETVAAVSPGLAHWRRCVLRRCVLRSCPHAPPPPGGRFPLHTAAGGPCVHPCEGGGSTFPSSSQTPGGSPLVPLPSWGSEPLPSGDSGCCSAFILPSSSPHPRGAPGRCGSEPRAGQPGALCL